MLFSRIATTRHAAIFLFLLRLVPTVLSFTSSPKRGLIYIPDPQHPEDDAIWTTPPSDLTWYYNYQQAPSAAFSSHPQLQFVPMLFGPPDNPYSNTSFLDYVKSQISAGVNISSVLFFNEPDTSSSVGGSNVAPNVAAQVWKLQFAPLAQLGVSLGAPAVSGGPGGQQWLSQFFSTCQQLFGSGGCAADFIPLHWYGSFEGLASYIGQMRGSYPNMSIWITEYAFADQSLTDAQTFANQTEEYFDRIDYIQRYSYFGAFRSDVSNVGPNAAFLTQDGLLTDIGAEYLGRPPTGNVPSQVTRPRQSTSSATSVITGHRLAFSWMIGAFVACFIPALLAVY